MTGAVLVCVTGQKSSERLIHKGAALAQQHQATLLVLSVSGSGLNVMSDPQVAQALDQLYRSACAVGAEMTMMQARDPHKAIVQFCKNRGVTHVVLGQSKDGSGSFISSLNRALPKVTFHIEPNA